MKILRKAGRFISVNKKLLRLLRTERRAGSAEKSLRFWFYAESLGEFRIALKTIEIIESVISSRENPAMPVFFISFKTYSAFELALKTVGEYQGAESVPGSVKSNVSYFFHPFNITPVIKKYLVLLKPDYFISVQHRISKNLFKLLSGCGSKIFFLGVKGEDLRKTGVRRIQSGPIPSSGSQSFVCGGAGEGKFACEALPVSLKFISCADDPASHLNPANTGKAKSAVVLSFVSIHEKEAVFIIDTIKSMLSETAAKSKGKSGDGCSEADSMSSGPRLRFIFVPRNVGLARKLFDTASERGLKPAYFNSSEGGGDVLRPFLEDSGGEHLSLIIREYGLTGEVYAASDIVYVGKSLFASEKGGHNILEPAIYGKCVISGEYAVNFSDIVPDMAQKGALTVTSPEKLKQCLENFINDRELRDKSGKAAEEFCRDKGIEFKNYFKKYFTENI